MFGSPQSSPILAVETSCDETAIAVLGADGALLAGEISSQIDIHRAFGGVVPEVASRQHLEMIDPVLRVALLRAGLALGDIGAFAATAGPGLASALLVGMAYAKGLALGCGRPFLAVNHLEGHLLSPFFGRTEGVRPCVALIVSGGHTLLLDVRGPCDYSKLGGTRDDAAGEAFDKVGKMLGLPYPGGPEIERTARGGDSHRFDLPRGLMHSDDFSFSFSGLKTAVRYLLPKLRDGFLPDLCASFQEAVIEVLSSKAVRAVRYCGRRLLAVSGGVSCNLALRERLTADCARAGIEVWFADPRLCTDNAAMIAFAARQHLLAGRTSGITTPVDPNLGL